MRKSYQLDKNKYKQYFFDGIDNKEEALEGIIYFTYYEDVFEKSLELQAKTNGQKTLTGKEELEYLIKRSTQVYKQFYRFIELNERPNVYNFYKETDEEQIRRKIEEKIEYLRQTPENISEYEINKKIEEKKKEIKRIYRDKEVPKEKIEKIERETREKLEKTKMLAVSENGLSYSIRQRFRFAHIPEGGLGSHQTKVQYHWTEELYDILRFLEEAEQKDRAGYTDIWLRTRLSRASTCEEKNRIQGIEEKEIRRIKHACERLRDMRIEDAKKKEKELGIEI